MPKGKKGKGVRKTKVQTIESEVPNIDDFKDGGTNPEEIEGSSEPTSENQPTKEVVTIGGKEVCELVSVVVSTLIGGENKEKYREDFKSKTSDLYEALCNVTMPKIELPWWSSLIAIGGVTAVGVIALRSTVVKKVDDVQP